MKRSLLPAAGRIGAIPRGLGGVKIELPARFGIGVSGDMVGLYTTLFRSGVSRLASSNTLDVMTELEIKTLLAIIKRCSEHTMDRESIFLFLTSNRRSGLANHYEPEQPTTFLDPHTNRTQ